MIEDSHTVHVKTENRDDGKKFIVTVYSDHYLSAFEIVQALSTTVQGMMDIYERYLESKQ